MDRIVHQVGFRSTGFPADPVEDETGLGGGSVAWWVAEVLAAAGLEVGEPFPEDYGWMVAVHGPGRVVATCGPTTPAADEWSVVIEDVPRRFRRPDPGAAALAQRAVDALAAALAAHPDVHDLCWDQGGPGT